jgi:hypothetical protein
VDKAVEKDAFRGRVSDSAAIRRRRIEPPAKLSSSGS